MASLSSIYERVELGILSLTRKCYVPGSFPFRNPVVSCFYSADGTLLYYRVDYPSYSRRHLVEYYIVNISL